MKNITLFENKKIKSNLKLSAKQDYQQKITRFQKVASLKLQMK